MKARSPLSLVVLLCLVGTVVPAAGQSIRYVDDDAPTGGTGQDWEHAYKCLQDALLEASGDPGIIEIHVAGGIYKPDQDEAGLVIPGDRQATFHLLNGLATMGGYRGCPGGDCGGGEADDRDIVAFETILSGDLLADDGPGPFENNDENSYHVTVGSGCDPTAVLDGVTVSSGNADGPDPDYDGGGMYNDGGSPTVSNCTISGNYADFGGGGVCCRNNSSPTLSNCTISGNSATAGGVFCFSSSSPTLSNCTISANSADSNGGGVFCFSSSSPTLTNCTISGNSANSGGGGVYCYNGSPTLSNCTISENSDDYCGGGLYCGGNTSPTLTNCTINGNSSADHGGGVYCYWYCSPTLSNCTISGNSAGENGGGVYCYHQSNATLSNCTISGNSANYGGGVYSWDGSSPTLSDCTISGNSAGGNGGGVNLNNSNATLANCTISGNSANFRGGGVYSHASSPALTNCTISGNSAGSYGGGVYCDAGYPVLGNCTINGNSADYGGGLYCYYSALSLSNCILWSNTPRSISKVGGSAVVTYCDVQGGWSGEGNIDADPLLTPDGHLQAGSPCLNAGDPEGVYTDQTDIDAEPRVIDGRVDIGADEWLDSDADALPDWWEDLYFGSPTAADPGADEDGDGRPDLVEYGGGTNPLVGPRTFYVDLGGADDWDGLVPVWDGVHGPKATVQAAMVLTDPYEGDEVVIADGVYTGPGNKNLDFHGKAMTVRSASGDPQTCVIDCEGDERGFDFHSGETGRAVVAGLTITNGYADLDGDDGVGGGVYCHWYSSPTLSHCTISGNSAAYMGGGVFCYQYSSPTLTNCTVSGNSADFDGGGMCCSGSSPALTNCTVSGNSADYYGGGVDCSSSAPTLTNCTISGNSAAESGGGVCCSSDSDPTLSNCTVSGNSAAYDGGGVFCSLYSSPTLSNCTVNGNSAAYDGGGIYCYSSSPWLRNCILWSNTPQAIYVESGNTAVTYGDVEGGWPGTGNIDADPRFVDPDGSDDVPGTEDDDLRLLRGSPCIDAGANWGVPLDSADLDRDGDTDERIPVDLAGNRRFINDLRTTDTGVPDPPDYRAVVDMGAYEYGSPPVPVSREPEPVERTGTDE